MGYQIIGTYFGNAELLFETDSALEAHEAKSILEKHYKVGLLLKPNQARFTSIQEIVEFDNKLKMDSLLLPMNCDNCKFAEPEFNQRTKMDMLVCKQKSSGWYDEFVLDTENCEHHILNHLLCIDD